MTISPPTYNPRTWFRTVKDTDNTYYSTKNQVRGLCVGGDMAILFFGNFTEIRENRPPRIFMHFLLYCEFYTKFLKKENAPIPKKKNIWKFLENNY